MEGNGVCRTDLYIVAAKVMWHGYKERPHNVGTASKLQEIIFHSILHTAFSLEQQMWRIHTKCNLCKKRLTRVSGGLESMYY